MKEALERKPAVEQRKQEVETRKQAVGEKITVHNSSKSMYQFSIFYFVDLLYFLIHLCHNL